MSNYTYREFSNSGTDKGDSCTIYWRRIKTNILSFVKVSTVCLYSKMRFLTCSRKGGGDVKIKKAFLTKCSNLVFSVMAVVAMIFANCQCSGRAYEPKLPEELK